MEALQPFFDMLTERFGPLGPLYAVGGLACLLIFIAMPVFMRREKDPLDRLNEKIRNATAADQKAPSEVAALRHGKGKDRLEKYSNFLEPQNEEEYSAIRMKMIQAGYRGKDAVRTFHFAQFALGVSLLIVGVAYVYLVADSSQMSPTNIVLYVLGPGVAGYMLPRYWITRRVEARKDEIANGFPDALDMLLVCVEAGQSLDQAIIRVSKELVASYPSLAEEFEIVSLEVKAGKDKSAVLADMAERAGVQDISSFVTVLVQSATFGTPVADALRVYASEMRDKRVMRAEEKANKLPTKMTLATMMLTVPPLLIILVGPSVLGITQLGNMSIGGP